MVVSFQMFKIQHYDSSKFPAISVGIFQFNWYLNIELYIFFSIIYRKRRWVVVAGLKDAYYL